MRIALFAAPGIMGPHVFTSLLKRPQDKVVLLIIASGKHIIGPEELLLLARQAEVPVVSPSDLESESFFDQIAVLSPDVILVASYDKKIPARITKIAKLAAVNVHPSLLPRYRGACPEFWAIRNGDSETGVSLHYLTETYDAGDILLQEKIAISPQETLGSLLYKLSELACALMALYLSHLEEGRELAVQRQDEKQVSMAPFIKSQDLFIRWENAAICISNLIRAVNPLAAAWTYFRGYQLKVWYAEVYDGDENPVEKELGELIVLKESEKLLVQTGEGFLEIGVVQFGLNCLVDGWHFSLNLGIRPGEKLGVL